MAVKPVLQALVLADHVYVDHQSGKKIIAGTFNRLWSREFPGHLGRITYAFICLTDVQGTAEIRLRYVDLKSNEMLIESGTVQVESDNPLASKELIVEIPPFPMPHPGVFAFEVYASDELLGSLRMTIDKLNPGEQQR